MHFMYFKTLVVIAASWDTCKQNPKELHNQGTVVWKPIYADQGLGANGWTSFLIRWRGFVNQILRIKLR